jgi:hypothetical protein
LREWRDNGKLRGGPIISSPDQNLKNLIRCQPTSNGIVTNGMRPTGNIVAIVIQDANLRVLTKDATSFTIEAVRLFLMPVVAIIPVPKLNGNCAVFKTEVESGIESTRGRFLRGFRNAEKHLSSRVNDKQI